MSDISLSTGLDLATHNPIFATLGLLPISRGCTTPPEPTDLPSPGAYISCTTSANSSSDDSAYFGSPSTTPQDIDFTGYRCETVPTCNISYHTTASQPGFVISSDEGVENTPYSAIFSLPPDLMSYFPDNFTLDPSYPSLDQATYTHPTYIENLNNKIMRRRGSAGGNKEQSTLNYLKELSRDNKYEEVFVIISNFVFSQNNHSWLQSLWLRGHNTREAQRLGRTLLPSDRLRLKRVHPFPKTIFQADDIDHQQFSKEFLKTFYGICQYPTTEEKMMLSKRCKLTYHQINSWFKNRRNRS